LSTASLPNLVSLVETRSVEPGCIAKSYVYATFHNSLPRTRSFGFLLQSPIVSDENLMRRVWIQTQREFVGVH
jgi:hypothetical protein